VYYGFFNELLGREMDKVRLAKAVVRRKKLDAKLVKESTEMCDEIKLALGDGEDVFGFTMGKISLIDIVELCAETIGNVTSVCSSIWSLSEADVWALGELQKNRGIASMRFIVDPSTYARKKESVDILYNIFGSSNVRTINTHAKFVALRGDTNLAIISSMNFTRNPRLEQFEITSSESISALIHELVDDVFKKYSEKTNFVTQSDTAFEDVRQMIGDTDQIDQLLNLDLL
jgi:hypothetical protein